MTFPNPRDNPDYFQRVIIGGRPVKASLVAIDGVEISDEWTEQKPTGHSGATNVFKGTKAPGPVTLTFETSDRDFVAEWDDLRELWELLAPKAGGGGNGTGATSGSPGSAAAGAGWMQAKSPASSQVSTRPEDLLAQAQAALAAVQSGANVATTAASSSTTTSSSSAASTPSPGPKPPTLSISNGYLAYVGITAISRSKWKGPYVTATNSHRVDLTVINQKEPRPAATGAAAPKTPDNPGQKQIAFGEIQDAASNARAANVAAAQVGALP
jgi:hypothetical protein